MNKKLLAVVINLVSILMVTGKTYTDVESIACYNMYAK